MVIVRAGLVQNETEDTSFLYERSVEEDFISTNQSIRSSAEFIPDVLITSMKSNSSDHYTKKTFVQPTVLPVNSSQVIPMDLTAEFEETPNFSLERESTISSNLSELFPRERITSRPMRNGPEQ